MIDSFSYSTTLIARTVRERSLLPLEEAVHYLTERPARLYGVIDRGVIAEGAHADLVLFDADRIGPGAVTTRFDLPGGAARVYGEAEGIDHVFVNGHEVVSEGAFTDARPGTLLRSGRDTVTPRQQMNA
jgi:N-acyl-D-aspartate/D-glutamate deacylase